MFSLTLVDFVPIVRPNCRRLSRVGILTYSRLHSIVQYYEGRP